MTEISEKEVRAVADVLLGRVNAPEQEIYRAARAALSAAARVREEDNAGGPVAWGEDIDGKIVSVRLDKRRHCTVPLYPAPQPSGTVDSLVEQIGALLALNKTGNVSHPIPGLAVELLKRSKEALSALTAGKPEQAVPSGWQND